MFFKSIMNHHSIILHQDPEYYVLKEDASPCIFGPIEKQRWSYACAKQLIERLVYGEFPKLDLSFIDIESRCLNLSNMFFQSALFYS